MTILALSLCLLGATQVQDDLPPLGTNLAGVADWTTQWPFVDLMKVARPWVSQKEGAAWGQGGPLEVDANGNVKSLGPGQFAETVLYSRGHAPKGSYTLLWDGKGEFAAHLGSTLSLEGPGRAKLDPSGDSGIFLMLKKVDPQDPPRNIRLLAPGSEHAETAFHPLFLQRMSLYRVLRFMDWGATNNSPLITWSDRPLPAQATYAGPKGVPVETMVDLANAKFADPWFCVPHKADDDYVRHLAQLVKERLRPEARVYVEYSNECWNGMFDQAKWCQQQGLALKLGDTPAVAGLRYYAQRSTEVFKIFEEVFGGRERLVRVLSAQAANRATGEEIVNWNQAYRQADAIAIAPYFGGALGSPENAERTKTGGLDSLFSSLKDEIKGQTKGWVEGYAELAQRRRLRLVAYEGGQHLVGTGSAQDDEALGALFDQANRDPRMGGLYVDYLKQWRAANGSLMVHFTDCAPFTNYGRWGTIEYQDQDPQTSWKNQALIQYALFPDR